MDTANEADRLQTLLYGAYDSDAVREMERPLLDDGVPLMRMAASAAAHVTMELLDDEDLAVEDARVTLLVGAGDNGGDGLYAGAELAQEGAQVTAIAVGRSLHEEAFAAFVHAADVYSCSIPPPTFPDAPPVFPQARPASACRRPSSTRRART